MGKLANWWAGRLFIGMFFDSCSMKRLQLIEIGLLQEML